MAACATDLTYTVRHRQYIQRHEQNPVMRFLVRRTNLPLAAVLPPVVAAECILVLVAAPWALSETYGVFGDGGYWYAAGMCAVVGCAAHASAILQSRRFVNAQTAGKKRV